MGEEQQDQQQVPERRKLQFPLRRRNRSGLLEPSGETFELEVWIPVAEQIAAIRGALTSAQDDQSEILEVLGDLVASFVLGQAVDVADGRRLRGHLMACRVSVIDAVVTIMEAIAPETATEPNRQDRREALKATRSPQQRRGRRAPQQR